MPQSLVLGNGSLLVNFNDRALVRDFYFPYAGLENHSSKKTHQLGLWVDGQFAWLSDPSWMISQSYEEKTMVGMTNAINENLGVGLTFTDVVYNEEPVFMRRVAVKNLGTGDKQVRVFFHQDFKIANSERADTAFFDSDINSIIHYKGKRCFVISAEQDDKPFQQYSIGLNDPAKGLLGTWKDAEDGVLSSSAIEHGPVDSVVGQEFTLNSEERICYYWIAAGKSIGEAKRLDQCVREKTPEHLIKTTRGYWQAWVTQQDFSFYKLPEKIIKNFYQSLFIIRTQVDNHGSILAANDSDLLKYGKDTYSYAWPRDGAMTALVLDKTGYSDLARKFFEFSLKTLSPDGYQLHKYLPDGSLASSWHPWVTPSGEPQLPIQEDETAIVIFALWEHWQHHKDLEFIEQLYNPLIKKSAHFLEKYKDRSGLPQPSYDLWEETRGVSTYSAASVYGGLTAAANFAELLGKAGESKKFRQTAEQIKKQILKVLWDEERQVFIKQLVLEETGELQKDGRLDSSSVYGIIRFGVLPIEDSRVQSAIEITRARLTNPQGHGGIIRYEGDNYQKIPDQELSNPWVITTLWQAQYQIALASSEKELEPVIEALEWAGLCSSSAGIMPEQINPYTGEPLSVAPLTWSHSVFVETVVDYLYKLEELGICKACVVKN